MDNNSLPNGFISIDDAVELIKTNTFNTPTIDIRWLVGHMDWIEEAHNFRIPKVRLITKEEYADYMEKHHGRRPSELVQLGSVFVAINTSFEKELLRKTIRDNYRDVAGREYVQQTTRGISTVKDEETGGSERPRATKKTIAKEGEIIGESKGSVTTNSADGAGV